MAKQEMRDPLGNSERYRKEIEEIIQQEEFISSLTPESLEEEAWFKLQAVATSLRLVILKYRAGDTIESIKDVVINRAQLMAANSEFVRHNGTAGQRDYSAIDGTNRADASFASIALTSVESSDYLSVFRQFLPGDLKKRSYVIDLLVKAFIPDHALLKKYKVDRHAVTWMDPFLRALASDPDEQSAALAIYMRNWCRMMRPWGWKPDLNPEPGKDQLFCDFAFEVALAVCAYDIDDSDFKDHPYYPRDLVEYYRANVRNTRDAWRPMAVGSGVQIIAPPPPKKADLAKTKRKGITRWIELVCDGDIDATESVLEVIGKPRKLDDIHELMEALSDAGQAIHGDIKDDETILMQAASVADDRALGEFDGPSGPPFGPARCSAGLLAFSAWLEARDYRLVDLDNDDDAWHAVVVKADYHAELIDLSYTLKIRTRTPEAVYND